MNRRGFLGALIAAPIAAKVLFKTAIGDAGPLQTLSEPAQGFGMATLKEEGAALAYDEGVITLGAHPAALWPGIREWWGREYAQHADEYGDIFKE